METSCSKSDDRSVWLNSLFVEKALQNILKDPKIRLHSFEKRPANAVGDNYASDMHRVVATYSAKDKEQRNLSVIVKCMPENNMTELLMGWNAFEKETSMLTEILPKMMEIMNKTIPERFDSFWGNCLFSGSNPKQFLVMEDLKPLGFRLADRFLGLDVEHCILVMKTIARFHACSVSLLRDNPQMYEVYKEGTFSAKTRDASSSFISISFQSLAKAMEGWGDDFLPYIPRLKKIGEHFYDTMTGILSTTHSGWNVLCHGDLWINNLLFRYEREKVVELRLVDFQVPYVTSPAVDLQYFINTSLEKEVRNNHTDLLLSVYHSEYNEILGVIGETERIISFDALKEEYERYNLVGLLAVVCVYPIVLRDTNKEFAIDNYIEGGEKLNNMKVIYSNPALVSVTKERLAIFYEKGVF